jgi:hypothetical protein
LYVGLATIWARVVTGGAAVIVAAVVTFAVSAIVGTVGDTYDVPVAESPDPPARLREPESSVHVAPTTTAAVTIAPAPTAAATDFLNFALMLVLQ